MAKKPAPQENKIYAKADVLNGHIQLVQGKEKGKQYWAYISFDPDTYKEYMTLVKNKKKPDPKKYGILLEHDFGKEPPEDLQKKIEKKYYMNTIVPAEAYQGEFETNVFPEVKKTRKQLLEENSAYFNQKGAMKPIDGQDYGAVQQMMAQAYAEHHSEKHKADAQKGADKDVSLQHYYNLVNKEAAQGIKPRMQKKQVLDY